MPQLRSHTHPCTPTHSLPQEHRSCVVEETGVPLASSRWVLLAKPGIGPFPLNHGSPCWQLLRLGCAVRNALLAVQNTC